MGDDPDQRDEPGMSLIEMAIAFVLDHPALTAAIIGPRAIDPLESQLPAADVSWTTGCFERIDETVPPGLNVNPADAGWVTRPPSGGAAALTSTPSGKAATARAGERPGGRRLRSPPMTRAATKESIHEIPQTRHF